MLARVHSGTLLGIDAYPIEVEIDVDPSLCLIVPAVNAEEAAVVAGIKVFGVPDLLTAAGFLMGRVPLEPAKPHARDESQNRSKYRVDFREVKGQEFAKRAVEVAAAGGHNVLGICSYLKPPSLRNCTIS